MATPWSLTFDCVDAARCAAFWTVALGYAAAPPPRGWSSWEDWLRDLDVPEEEWGDGATLADPAGVLPTVGFLRVPEPKTTKNRLHLDLRVSGGRDRDYAVREELIRAKVAELVAVGGQVVREVTDTRGLDHIVMQDPEGNELCVV